MIDKREETFSTQKDRRTWRWRLCVRVCVCISVCVWSFMMAMMITMMLCVCVCVCFITQDGGDNDGEIACPFTPGSSAWSNRLLKDIGKVNLVYSDNTRESLNNTDKSLTPQLMSKHHCRIWKLRLLHLTGTSADRKQPRILSLSHLLCFFALSFMSGSVS